jgi:hypothetical protein
VGLLDDCVDVSSDLGQEPGLAPGRLVSGALPSGRVCADTTFVYSVRYGPYESCGAAGRAAASVRAATADTRRHSSAMAEVGVAVGGCEPAVVAAVASLRPAADLQAEWTVRLEAGQRRLRVRPGARGNATFAVAYDRMLRVEAPRLLVQLALTNVASTAELLGQGSYTVNTTCAGADVSRSAAFVCGGGSNKVPPSGGSVNCSLVVPLPCAAAGTLQAQVQLASGLAAVTPVTRFDAPDAEAAADAGRGGGAATCVQVR